MQIKNVRFRMFYKVTKNSVGTYLKVNASIAALKYFIFVVRYLKLSRRSTVKPSVTYF